jgi:hypothetical protein
MPNLYDEIGEEIAAEIDGWMHSTEFHRLQSERAGMRISLVELRAQLRRSRFYGRWLVVALAFSWALFLIWH